MDKIDKLIKIIEGLMLMEGLGMTKEEKNNIREYLSNSSTDIDEVMGEIIKFYEDKER